MPFKNLRESLVDILHYWDQDTRNDDIEDFSKYTLLDKIKESDSFKLYKYMPADYYGIRNFETQNIHLSPNGILNDVYEGLPVLVRDNSNGELAGLCNMAYISCFTERKDNILMWSHYAASHSGICVEYDLKRLSEKNKALSHLFPVIYNKNRFFRKNVSSLASSLRALDKAISEGYEYDGDEILDDILPLFVSKGTDWSYEQEWRIIYTKKQMYDAMDYSNNLNFPCVNAVYLGYRIETEKKNHIKDICIRYNQEHAHRIKLYQSRLADDTYDILFEEILL